LLFTSIYSPIFLNYAGIDFENFTSYIHNTQTYEHYNSTVITVPYNMWPVR